MTTSSTQPDNIPEKQASENSENAPTPFPSTPDAHSVSDGDAKAARHRSHSSVGRLNLGDTSVPGLQSIASAETRSRQNSDLNKDTGVVASDSDVFAKLWTAIKILSIRYTWAPPLAIMILLRLAYVLSNNYTSSNPLYMLFEMSYEEPGSEPPVYGKGWKDYAFIAHMVIFFTFLRGFMMQAVLGPIATYFGIKSAGKRHRFMEQAYSMFYYGLSSPFGLYVMYHTPIWFFRTAEFYREYPHRTHEWLFKLYYLGQAGFWTQQSIVLMLQLEKPRKDFKELVFHHIVTMLLIGCSYRFHFTWIGLAVYITMDVSDFFLATSKTLNYLNSPLVPPFFVVFVGVWFYTRHWLNLRILWSVLTEFKTIGPWELNWETQQYKCWIAQPIVFTLIFALQLVNIYWFFLVLRIFYRFIFCDSLADERSDDESDESEVDQEMAALPTSAEASGTQILESGQAKLKKVNADHAN